MLMPMAPRAALLGSGTTSHVMDCNPTPSVLESPIVEDSSYVNAGSSVITYLLTRQ